MTMLVLLFLATAIPISAFWPACPPSFRFPFVKSSTTSQKATNQEWNVDLYKKHSFVYEYGSSLVDVLNPQPGERILDVGCGSGVLSDAIAQRGAIVTGMDADPSMIAQAQKEFPKVEFVQGDIANWLTTAPPTDDDHQYDAIFSNAALHWVKDAKSAVATFARVLKPNGRLVVEFGGRGNIEQIVQASLLVLREQQNVVHPTTTRFTEPSNPWYFPSISEYTQLLETHGFEVLEARLYDRPTHLEGGMANWLRMFGGTLLGDTPPPDSPEREETIEKIVDKLRNSGTLWDSKNQTWKADYRRIRIVAICKKQ